MVEIQNDLIVYGRSSYHLGERKVEVIMRRVSWWSKRLEKIANT